MKSIMKSRIPEILGIKYPIVQGPMSWLTNAESVAAVSNAGGLGILGPNAGQTTLTTSVEETTERMRREIQKTKTLTDKPFGVTLIISSDMKFTTPIIKMIKEEGVKVALVNGITEFTDKNLINELHNNGIKVVYRAWQPSIQDAKNAEEAEVDVYVATGFDEGGTVPGKVIGSFAIAPMIADVLKKTPMMLAGGITDIRTVRAAFALGAEGVYVGTRFLAVKESPTAENIKQMIVNQTAEDMLMYRTVPAYYRSFAGNLPNKLVEMDKSGATEEEIFKAMNGYIGMRDGMLFGDLDKGFASVGLGISSIKEIVSTEEAIKEMMADFID